MRTPTRILLAAVLVIWGVGTACAETIFVTEPMTPIRPRPGLRVKPMQSVSWGSAFERVKIAGDWSRISYTDTSDAFIWSAWVATCNVAEAKTVAKGRREVYFTVEKIVAKPVLEAMCADVLDLEKAATPGLEELTIRGYVASRYPKGEPLCTARWAAAAAPKGTGGTLEVTAPELAPVTPRDEEMYDAVTAAFRSTDRAGESIFAVDEVWAETAKSFGVTVEDVRYAFDRVRWTRTGLVK